MERPTSPARWERIASLELLNKKRKGWRRERGRNGQSFRVFSGEYNFSPCSSIFYRAFLIRATAQNEQIAKKQTAKKSFSDSLAAPRCRVFECMSIFFYFFWSVSTWFFFLFFFLECVGRYSIFSFPHIKGAINFTLLPLAGCNTHTLIQPSGWALTWLTLGMNSFTK